MHTFELCCDIHPSEYTYLHDNLPGLSKVSKYVERTNYYSAKGIMQIELRTFEYLADTTLIQRRYLVLRCNPSIIMGDCKVFLVDMEQYSPAEIVERLQKRLYEINEFRYIKLDKRPITIYRTNRADIAEDISYKEPKLLAWLCNMSMPYGYRNMKRKPIQKDADTLYFESCCFCSKSRGINFYVKYIAMINTGREVSAEDLPRAKQTFRAEVQIQKKGINYLATKLPTKKSIEPFLEQDFCHNYLLKEVRAMFGIQKYVSMSRAVETIQNSQYKPYDKAVMVSILTMIQQYRGLYELEKAIADKAIYTPPQYGNLRTFRERWLKKIRRLGIQPTTIPDSFGIDEVPSIYELLEKIQEEQK